MTRNSGSGSSQHSEGPREVTPCLSARARDDLEQLYRDVDSDLHAGGFRCWLRGECCDFERTDHRLYATSLEIAYVRERHRQPFPSGDVRCPFWKQGRCTERERRPLGCRIYFCDASASEALAEIYERYHRRLRETSERHGIPYRYEHFVSVLRTGPVAPAGTARPETEVGGGSRSKDP